MSHDLLDVARDTAQQMVTCLLAGDRPQAVTILDSSSVPHEVMALVMADLVAYTHHRWARSLGIDRAEAWQELMLDVEAWRVES